MASQVAKNKKTARKASSTTKAKAKKVTRTTSKKTKAAKSSKAGKTKAAKTRKKAAKATPAKSKAGRKSTARALARKSKEASATSVELAIEELDAVEELLEGGAEATPKPSKAAGAAKKKAAAASKAPRTPTVPRTVKPTPKVADLEMDPEVLRFIDAIDSYKQEYSRPFPSWREVYYVFKQLGYDLAD